MDLITQAALGAAIGELVLGKFLGKKALAWGALVGILPEIDVLLFAPFGAAAELALRRGPTHSLCFIAVVAYGLAHWRGYLWSNKQVTKWRAVGFGLAALGGHILLDCLTAEGAAVLWPFSGKMIGFGLLYQHDFLFAGPLVAAAAWLACVREVVEKKKVGRGKKKPQLRVLGKRPRVCLWGLGLSGCYLMLGFALKLVASQGFDRDLARRGVAYLRQMEVPTPYNIFLWRAVVDRGDEFWVGYRSVFDGAARPVRWTIYPQGKSALASVSDLNEVATVMRVTDGWWIARAHAKGAWIGDLRPGESRSWGDKKGMVDSRLAFSWVLVPEAKGDRLRQIEAGNTVSNDGLSRIFARTFGNLEAWEANPRLAGAKGALPEFLPVEE